MSIPGKYQTLLCIIVPPLKYGTEALIYRNSGKLKPLTEAVA
jgi:hypothetical protein